METESGAEYISEAHVRHIMRYVQARHWLKGIPDLILDAACGTGYGTKLLARAHFNMLGVDSSEVAIAEAHKDKPDNCRFMHADLLTTRFAVDAIISIETLEHFSEQDGRKLVGNFNKWLSRDGMLIISTPYCDKSGPSPITKQHLWEYSLTDLEQLLYENGFYIHRTRITRHNGQAGRRGYCMVKAIKK